MSENIRRRTRRAGCAAPQTVTTVYISPATQVGLEAPSGVDRVVLHIGGIESLTDLELHMSAADLLRIYLILGNVAIDVIPADQLEPLFRRAVAEAHLWGVDYVPRVDIDTIGGAP